MITFLKILFSGLFIFMNIIVIDTSLKSNLFEEWDFLAAIPWMTATLWDFYTNVLVLLCWVFYKETNWIWKITWLILFCTLGSIATCLYVLIALFRSKKGETVRDLLVKQH
jgi:hypothetical protein